MTLTCLPQNVLDAIFPPERTNTFFEALYGDAEEGAYDIRLICRNITETQAQLAFELACRPGQCLRCNLTYGLPQVFQRHPIIAIKDLAEKVAKELGWQQPITWSVGPTEEESEQYHFVPFTIVREI